MESDANFSFSGSQVLELEKTDQVGLRF